MNPCTASCVDRQLIPPGSQSEAEMDGRDSLDGQIPAVEMDMSGDTGETTPTRDKPNDGRVRTTV